MSHTKQIKIALNKSCIGGIIIYRVIRTNQTDELIHHGILGQKWGIRRYQNPDGTLTAAGKKRYRAVETKKATKAKDHYFDISKQADHDLTEYWFEKGEPAFADIKFEPGKEGDGAEWWKLVKSKTTDPDKQKIIRRVDSLKDAFMSSATKFNAVNDYLMALQYGSDDELFNSPTAQKGKKLVDEYLNDVKRKKYTTTAAAAYYTTYK